MQTIVWSACTCSIVHVSGFQSHLVHASMAIDSCSEHYTYMYITLSIFEDLNSNLMAVLESKLELLQLLQLVLALYLINGHA